MQTWFINSVPLLAVALRSSCGLSSASSGTLGSFVISHCVGDNSLTYQINCLKGTVRLTKASSCELSQLEHTFPLILLLLTLSATQRSSGGTDASRPEYTSKELF